MLNFSMMGLGFHFFVKDDASLGLQRIDRAFRNTSEAAEEMYFKTKQSLDTLERRMGALGDARVQAALSRTGMALAGIGTAGLFMAGSAVRKFADFEQQMLNIRAIAELTSEQFEELSRFAIQVGADTKFSASQAAQAIYEIASAGVTAVEDIKALTRGVTDFAAATGINDLGVAARTIVGAVQAFQLGMEQATHVADVFTKATSISQFKAEEFEQAIASVGGVARMVGQSLEATTAGLIALRNAGIAAQDGATSMRAALLRLTAPTTEMVRLMDVLNINVRDASGAMKPWPQIVRELETSFAGAGPLVQQFASFAGASEAKLKALAKTYGLTTSQVQEMTAAAAQGEAAFRDYVLATLFGQDGIRALATALNVSTKAMIDGREVTLYGSDALQYWQEQLEKSAGAAQRAAEIQLSGLSGAMEQLAGSIESAQLALAKNFEPTLIRVLGWLRQGVDLFTRLPAPVQGAAAAAIALGSALSIGGGLFLILLAQLPNAIQGMAILRETTMGQAVASLFAKAAVAGHTAALWGKMAAALAVRGAILAWTGAQWALNAALNANPIGLVVAGVVALIAVGYLLVRNWDRVTATIGGWWDSLRSWFGGLPGLAKAALAVFAPFIGLPLLIAENWDRIVAWFQALPGEVAAFLAKLPGAVSNFFVQDLPYWVGYGLGVTVRLIVQGIDLAIDFLASLPERAATFLADLYGRAVAWFGATKDAVGSAAANAVDAAVAWFASLPGRAWEFLSAIPGHVRQIAGEWYAAARSTGQQLVDGAMEFIASLPGRVWDALMGVVDTVLGAGPRLWNAAKTAFGRFVQGFKEGMGIHSPSYVERAMASIVEASRTATSALAGDFRRIANLRAAPTLELRSAGVAAAMAAALALPAPAGPVAHAPAAAIAAPAPAVAMPTPPAAAAAPAAARAAAAMDWAGDGGAAPEAMRSPAIIVRQPVQLVVDGRVLAETVLEVVLEDQARTPRR